MKNILVIQSHYKLDYLTPNYKCINSSISNVRSLCNKYNIDYKLYTNDSNLPEFSIPIDESKLFKDNFDSIKILTISENIDKYSRVIHIDNDSFFTEEAFIKVVFENTSHDIYVPWYEFTTVTSRRVKVTNYLKDRLPELPINSHSRTLLEYNTSVLSVNKNGFNDILSTYYKYLEFIRECDLDEDLKDYIIPYFPLQIGMATLDNVGIIFKDTVLQESEEGYFMIVNRLDRDSYLHFGGLNKHIKLASDTYEQYL